MMSRTYDKLVSVMFVCVLLYAGTAALIYSFSEPKDMNVTFEVIGIQEPVNATTIVQLHYECIRMCNDYYYGSIQKLTSCWDQCANLGK